jgi:hemoglobin/transferrin/lactoferrin receptor protein
VVGSISADMRVVLLIQLVLLLQLSSPVDAQPAALVGRVVDANTGAAVAGATVTIACASGSVRTDATGAFKWERPPTPPFQVIVVLPGGQVATPVDIKSIAEPATIPVDALAREAITVIGAAPSISTAPAAATSILPASQIARRNPDNLLQALETVPGINVVSEGHASVPAIRGLARGRTLVLIDGARVTAERRVGPSATFADPVSFDGIDVARGPGSVAYGSDALGGVISVRTRRAVPGSPLTVRGSGTFGGGIPERRGSLEVTQGFSRGGVLVQAHVRDADDWDSPLDGTTVLNSGWEDHGFLARLDHEVAGGVLSVGWQSDFGRDIERPRNNSQTVRFYYPFENSHRLTTTYEIGEAAGFQQVAFTGFVGTFEQRTDQDRFATSTAGRSIERADVQARDFHVKGSAVRGIGRARVEFGLDVNGRFGLEAIDTLVRYDLASGLPSQIENLSVDDARRTDTGAYIQANGALTSSLRVAAGARGDYVSTTNVGGYFGDRETGNGAFSGFTALTAGPFGGLNLTAQVSRGFRDPTLSDRYFRGPSGRGFITGNPDLEPEKSLQFDLGARYAIGRTQLGAFVYNYRINDLVERYSTQTDFFFFRNQGRARIRGFEFEARTELPHGIALEGGVNISRGVALDTGTDLDDIGPDSMFVIGRKDFMARAFAQVRASFLSGDDRPGPSEVEAPGAQVVDLSAGWRFSKSLELRGIVRNLFDDAYYASPDPRWVYAPGRSASVTLAFDFQARP